MYKQMRRDKIEEIVVLLDLFEGKVSLTEILTTDISLLNQLRDAKLLIKKRQEALMTAQSKGVGVKGNNSVTLMNPSTLKKGNE